MADLAVHDLTPRLDLGRVARDTLAVTGKRPVFVIGLSFLLSGLPNFFGGVFASHHMHGGFYFFSGFGLVHVIVLILLSSFLSASLYRLALGELEGETPTPNEVFTTGAQLFLPLFAVNLLYFLAVCLGLVLFIVPGVMLALAWCVAGPALIDRKTGITQSLGESAQLTHGNRWRLLALFVLFGLAVGLVNAVFNAVGLAASYAAEGLLSGPRLLGSAIIATATTALATPGAAAIYVQLRELGGG
jgi:hypothetical protein